MLQYRCRCWPGRAIAFSSISGDIAVDDTPYQGSDRVILLWDVQNRRRLGRYLTDTVSGFIARHLPQGSGRVLDIACGTGKLSQSIDSHGYERVSLEYDFEPLRWFCVRDSQALLVNADAQALPFAATVSITSSRSR